MEKQIADFLKFILGKEVGSICAKTQKGAWQYSYDGTKAAMICKSGRETWNMPTDGRDDCLVMAIEAMMCSRKLFAVVQKEQGGVEFPALAGCSPLEIELGRFYAADAEKRIAEAKLAA